MSTETVSSQPNVVAEEVVDAAPKASEVSLLGPIERTLTSVQSFVAVAKSTVYDITTTAGDNTARQLRKRCVDLRSDAKREYEEGNAPLLVAQRRARALVEQINAIIAPIETALDKDIKSREEKKAQEKSAREELERIRVGEIRKRIAAIGSAVLSVATGTSAEIDAKHSELLDATIADELFGDFVDEAEGARGRAVAELALLYDRVKDREQQEAELHRQQAELAEQRRVIAEQQRVIAEEREAQAQKQAVEQDRIAPILDRLQSIRECGTEAANIDKTALQTADTFRCLEAYPIDKLRYEEFYDEALALKASTLFSITQLHDSRTAAEAEVRRLDEQRQSLASQAAELKRQTDAFEVEKKVAAALIVQQKKDADAKAEAELKAIEASKPAAAQEQAASAPAVVERPVTKAAPVLVQPVIFQRASRPDDEDIVTCLARNFGATEHDALEWISTFDITAQANRLRTAA